MATKTIQTLNNHYSNTNNPFALRNSNDAWLGKIGQNQKGFVVFDTIENGLRAGLKNLYTQFKKGNDTIAKLITVYAPPHENNTAKYIENVCNRTGKQKDAKITKNDLPNIGLAILKQEFGYTPTPEVWQNAVKAALGNILQQVVSIAFLFLLQRLGLSAL